MSKKSKLIAAGVVAAGAFGVTAAVANSGFMVGDYHPNQTANGNTYGQLYGNAVDQFFDETFDACFDGAEAIFVMFNGALGNQEPTYSIGNSTVPVSEIGADNFILNCLGNDVD